MAVGWPSEDYLTGGQWPSEVVRTSEGRTCALAEAHTNYKLRKYPTLNLIMLILERTGRPGIAFRLWLHTIYRDTDPIQRSRQIDNAWQTIATTLQLWNVKIIHQAGHQRTH